MKKIIISIGIILSSCILAFVLVLVINNEKKSISLTSLDHQVCVDLGKYKVTNYTKDALDGANQVLKFKVKEESDFYALLSKSDYFRKDLDFKVDNYFAFGFLEKEHHFFMYSIQKSNVKMIAIEGSIQDNRVNYYLPLPLKAYLTKSRLESNSVDDIYYQTLIDEQITFDMIKVMLNYIDQSIFKFENGIVYLKGISGLDLVKGNITYTNNYLVKIIEEEETVYVKNND